MKPKILLVGPITDFSGYAATARNYALALDSTGVNVVTRNLYYDGGSRKLTPRELQIYNKDTFDVDIVIQQTTPNEMEYKEGVFNVGAFCWETDKIPQIWVEHLNRMDLVLVPVQKNLEVARKCGVVVPIEKVPYSSDITRFNNPPPKFNSPYDDCFKLLSVCQYSKKKGVDALLKSYFAEFDTDENVVLILKLYVGPNDGPDEAAKVSNLIGAAKQVCRLKSYPKLHLIHEVIPHSEMDRLYSTADCYVLPSRGEGWGVPHFDALGFGMPAIALKGTGPEEFIDSSCGWLVDSHESPVIDMPHPFDFLYTAKENWVEPNCGSLKTCMREAYNLWSSRYNSTAWSNMCFSALRRSEKFSNEAIGPVLYETIMKYYQKWRADVS